MNRSQVSPPSDLEILAAFIENRLPDAERRQVEERLAQDEDFYEVYTETLQTLEELDAEPIPLTPEPITPRLDRRARTRVLSLAASLVLVSGLVMTWAMPRFFLGSTEPVDLSPRLVARIQWDLRALHPTTRSANEPDSWTFGWDAHGIHLGVHLTDLRIALQHHDWRAAEHAVDQLILELNGNPLLSDPEGFLGRLASDLQPPEGSESPGLTPDKLERHLQASAEKDELFDQTYEHLGSRAYRLGKWLETTRLIALSQDERSLRKRLRRLTAAERIILDSDFEEHKLQRSQEILDRLERLRDAGQAEAFDFTAIAKQLEDLIVELGRESLPREY